MRSHFLTFGGLESALRPSSSCFYLLKLTFILKYSLLKSLDKNILVMSITSSEASVGEIKFLNLNPFVRFVNLNPFVTSVDWIPRVSLGDWNPFCEFSDASLFEHDTGTSERRPSKNGVVRNVSSTFLKKQSRIFWGRDSSKLMRLRSPN